MPAFPRLLALPLAVAAFWIATPHDAAAEDPAAACSALANSANAARFGEIPDAPTTVAAVRVVPATRDLPEHCRVDGIVAPSVGFLLRMPTRTWNGKFMMGGCGGPCGNYLVDRIDPALVRNYAVVTTDMGHKGPGWSFGYHNLQGQIDFGYRASHVTQAAAKAIIAAYYGKAAARNYYWGCSTGGRQGLVFAQRFPQDFEGLIAGAPVLDETGDGPYFLEWGSRVNLGPDGKAILTADKLPLVHKAVLAACDALDGLADGILLDPRRCAWDPAQLLCKGGPAKDCLTKAEADVVRKIYEGASNSKGEKLYWGMARGSEDQWSPFWIPRTAAESSLFASNQALPTAFMAFFYPPGPGYTLNDFDYDRDPARLALTESLYSAKNPDLRGLQKAGGRLILYHGTHDNNIPYRASADYYETATRTMGGEDATRRFFRFFALPAVNHCRYGLGGGEVDWLTVLETWVERGEAPDFVVAHHMVQEPYPIVPGAEADTQGTYTQMARHPLPAGSYDRTRPVYAWPDQARYKRTGDPARAGNWEKAPRR